MAKEREKSTFEDVWQALMETRKLMQENDIKAEKRAAEWEKRNAEYEKARKERAAEAEKAAEKRVAEWERERKERDEAAKKRNAEWDKKMQELTETVNRTTATVDRTSAAVDRTTETVNRTSETVNKTSKDVRGISLSNGAMAEEAIYNVLEKEMTFGGRKFDAIRKNLQIVSGIDTKTELDVLMVNGDTVAIIEAKYKVDKDDLAELFTKQLKYFRQYYTDYSNHKVILGIGGMSFEEGVIQSANKKGVGIIKIIGDKLEFHTDGIKKY